MCLAEADEMKSIAMGIAGAVSSMDAAALKPFLTEDAVLEFPYAAADLAHKVTGLDAVLEVMGATPRLFSHFRYTLTSLYTSLESQSLIAEAESEGALISGGAYRNRYVILFTFRGGKVALWREYFDPLRLPGANLDSTVTEKVRI